MMNRWQNRIQSRRALTTVAVLVCLIVVTMICAALLKVGLAQRTQVRSEERNLQAEWLAESGFSRALAQLDANPNYSGEKWSIRAHELSFPSRSNSAEPSSASVERAALIAITVDRVDQEPNRRRIRVQADYGLDPVVRSRHTKQVSIDLEPEKAGVAP